MQVSVNTHFAAYLHYKLLCCIIINKYRKIPIISPGLILIFVQKTFLLGLFSGNLFSEGLIIERNFAFQNGLGLTVKTANSNFPLAYIWEGLLLEGCLHLRLGGLIFGRAYYRNFMVFSKWAE